MGGYEAAEAAADQVERTYAAHRPADRRSSGRDRGRGERHPRLGHGLLRADLRPGDRILTARAEYASNVIAFLQVARRTGAVVEVIENDETGQVSVSDLRRRLGDDKRPGEARRDHPRARPRAAWSTRPKRSAPPPARPACPYLLDACQSVGQLPVDVERIGCDMLSATGRKFLRGPRGTGLPLRPPRLHRPGRAAVPRPARRDLDRAGHVRDPPGRPTLRELGDQLRRQDRPRRRRGLRAVLGPGRDRGTRHRPRRTPTRAA